MISKAVLPNLWHRSPGPLNFSPGLIFRGAVGSTGGFLKAGLVVGVGGRGEDWRREGSPGGALDGGYFDKQLVHSSSLGRKRYSFRKKKWKITRR